jgi:hypothetical protein
MKKRFSEEQIIGFLKEADTGWASPSLADTSDRWKDRVGGERWESQEGSLARSSSGRRWALPGALACR